MKELLYIPSGRYVRFWNMPNIFTDKFPTLSIEEYVIVYNNYYKSKTTIESVMGNIRCFNYHKAIFEYAEIPLEQEKPIPLIYFELVDTD